MNNIQAIGSVQALQAYNQINADIEKKLNAIIEGSRNNRKHNTIKQDTTIGTEQNFIRKRRYKNNRSLVQRAEQISRTFEKCSLMQREPPPTTSFLIDALCESYGLELPLAIPENQPHLNITSVRYIPGKPPPYVVSLSDAIKTSLPLMSESIPQLQPSSPLYKAMNIFMLDLFWLIHTLAWDNNIIEALDAMPSLTTQNIPEKEACTNIGPMTSGDLGCDIKDPEQLYSERIDEQLKFINHGSTEYTDANLPLFLRFRRPVRSLIPNKYRQLTGRDPGTSRSSSVITTSRNKVVSVQPYQSPRTAVALLRNRVATEYSEILQMSPSSGDKDGFFEILPYVTAFITLRMFAISFPRNIECITKQFSDCVYENIVKSIQGRSICSEWLDERKTLLFPKANPEEPVCLLGLDEITFVSDQQINDFEEKLTTSRTNGQHSTTTQRSITGQSSTRGQQSSQLSVLNSAKKGNGVSVTGRGVPEGLAVSLPNVPFLLFPQPPPERARVLSPPLTGSSVGPHPSKSSMSRASKSTLANSRASGSTRLPDISGSSPSQSTLSTVDRGSKLASSGSGRMLDREDLEPPPARFDEGSYFATLTLHKIQPVDGSLPPLNQSSRGAATRGRSPSRSQGDGLRSMMNIVGSIPLEHDTQPNQTWHRSRSVLMRSGSSSLFGQPGDSPVAPSPAILKDSISPMIAHWSMITGIYMGNRIGWSE